MTLCHGRRQNDAEAGKMPITRSRARRALLAASGCLISDNERCWSVLVSAM